MDKETLLKEASDLLSVFSVNVDMLSKAGYFSVNKISENIYLYLILDISLPWKFFIFFVLIIIVKGLIPRCKLAKANRAKKDERYSEAYQIYNSIIVQYSNKYKIPEVKEMPLSIGDLSDVGKTLAKSAANFWIKKPSSSNCFMALEGSIAISDNITIFEVYTNVESETKLSLSEYKDIWKDNLYPDQKDLPLSVNSSLESMYNANICLVQLVGDGNTYFEGVFFNPEENICFKIEKKPGSPKSKLLSMKTGNWLSVIRINRTLSDHINDNFFNARGIQGRWYIQPFTLKSEYHLFNITFEISGGPDFPLS